eukprot:7285680-Prymnesium_polylepis.1
MRLLPKRLRRHGHVEHRDSDTCYQPQLEVLVPEVPRTQLDGPHDLPVGRVCVETHTSAHAWARTSELLPQPASGAAYWSWQPTN